MPSLPQWRPFLFCVAGILGLGVPGEAAVRHQPAEAAWPPVGSAAANFVAFHKTGYVIAQTVSSRCTEVGQVAFYGNGLKEHPVTMPTVLFLRDGFALAKSAYFYHLEVSLHEDWLRDSTRRPPPEWTEDPTVSAYLRDGESYQEFLNRVPRAIGVRAEYLRSALEYEQIVNDTRTCKQSAKCMTVCMERFTASSESYNQTWSKILNFVGLDDSYLDCVSRSDLNNPAFRGQEEHAVSRHIPGSRSAKVDKLLRRIDRKVRHGWLRDASKRIACA